MKRFLRRTSRTACIGVCATVLGATPAVVGQSEITLVATGSSLPQPLYRAWGEEFQKTHPGVQLRYLPEGTAESASRILAGVGDFGGGDAPIPESLRRRAEVHVLELPSVLIGVAVVYNLPGNSGELRLSGALLADIFLGKVRRWNDPQLAKLNLGLKLPDAPVKVFHRTGGKGSNYIFSDYLCKVSAEFQAKAGRGASPKWPVGKAVNHTEDLLEQVQATPGAIAYTELNWAEKAGLRMAKIRNAAGEFVKPSAKSIAEAAAVLESKMGEDFHVSLTNAAGKHSYPISSFTWLYVPLRAANPQRGRVVASFLNWVYTRGQEIAQQKGYAPLPVGVLVKVRARAATIR